MNIQQQRNKEKYEGLIFETNSYGACVVVEYKDKRTVVIKFLETGSFLTVLLSNLKKGNVKDYMKPVVFGKGFLGKDFSKVYLRGEVSYSKWVHMIRRCYDIKSQKSLSTYRDCSVSSLFHNFSYFKDWCEKQKGFSNKGWHLDKDILVKGNKVYSEDACCFVPAEINGLFTLSNKKRGKHPLGVSYHKRDRVFTATVGMNGKNKHLGYYKTSEEAFQAYKQAKEAYIKEVAELYKDQIDTRVYEALMKYEVDIND